ncbi:MAG: hypothetical protein JWN73_506 [Betaproteobacteria bacterium]|nr:hypothetical protein [Betaproteobacteria bacterium]
MSGNTEPNNPFPRNRYPAATLIAAFDRSGFFVAHGKCMLELDIGGDYEPLEIYFPAIDDTCPVQSVLDARALLQHVSALDNLVQD